MQTMSVGPPVAGAPAVAAARDARGCACVEEWIERCCGRLLQLDPALVRAQVAPIVDDMSRAARWLALKPEDAADRVFVPHPLRAAGRTAGG